MNDDIQNAIESAARVFEKRQHDDFLRMDSDVKEVRADVVELKTTIPRLIREEVQAGLAPIVEMFKAKNGGKHFPQSPDGKSIIYALGAPIFSLVFILLWVVWGQLSLHTEDKHPTSVQAELKQLEATTNAFIEAAKEQYLRRQEYEQISAADKLLLAKDLADDRVTVARELATLAANASANKEEDALRLMAIIKSMELGGSAGRESATNKGRQNAEIQGLKDAIEHIRREQKAGRN